MVMIVAMVMIVILYLIYIASLKKPKKREEMIEFTTKINIFARETYVISCHLILYGMVFVGISFE